MPRLIYSLHALERMEERGISRAEVLEVWEDRATISLKERGDRRSLVILGTTMLGRRLKLVLDADDETFVVTVADRDTEE